MQVSIVIPTVRPDLLANTLASIRRPPQPKLEYEVIVVCDNAAKTKETLEACAKHDVDVCLHTENTRYRNPAVAWNVGFRRAQGEIVIPQADDCMYASTNAIETLVRLLHDNPGRYIVATVFNWFRDRITRVYTAPDRQRPNMCLTCLWRYDIYAIGGLEEEFPEPGWDDNYRELCLTAHGVYPLFTSEVVGFHQDHGRPKDTETRLQPASEAVYHRRRRECETEGIPYVASGGPWQWRP